MKRTHLHLAGLAIVIGMAACTGNSGTTSSSDSTSATTMNPGDSSVTTTTTVTHHKYSGNFTPKPDIKYIDLKTHQQVTVRIDTVRGEVVNSQTNEPIDLLVEPTTHDTIYGMTGTVVNNYITRNESGDYKVDTVAINNPAPTTAPINDTPEHTGNYKEKDRYNKKR